MEMCKVTDSANILSWIQQYLWKMGQPSALSASQENCSWKHWIAGRMSKALLLTPFKIALLLQPGMGHPQALCRDSWEGCDKEEQQERSWSRLAPTSFPPHLLRRAFLSPSRKGCSGAGSQASHTLFHMIHNFSVILSKLFGSRSFSGLLLQSLKLLLRIIHLNNFVISVKISLFQQFQ